MAGETDRIQKQILLRAPRSRVWRALSDAKEFGAWFGVALEGPLAPGARRAQAYRMNADGWGQQMKSIEQHLAKAR